MGQRSFTFHTSEDWGPFLFPSLQSTESWAASLRDGKQLGEQQLGLQMHQRNMDSTKLHHGLHQEAHPIAAGMPYPWIPPTGTWAPTAHCVPHSHIPTLWPAPYTAPESSKGELWQTVSEHVQKAGQNLWARKKPQTWAFNTAFG